MSDDFSYLSFSIIPSVAFSFRFIPTPQPFAPSQRQGTAALQLELSEQREKCDALTRAAADRTARIAADALAQQQLVDGLERRLALALQRVALLEAEQLQQQQQKSDQEKPEAVAAVPEALPSARTTSAAANQSSASSSSALEASLAAATRLNAQLRAELDEQSQQLQRHRRQQIAADAAQRDTAVEHERVVEEARAAEARARSEVHVPCAHCVR